jgi:hypothetical protein
MVVSNMSIGGLYVLIGVDVDVVYSFRGVLGGKEGVFVQRTNDCRW